MQTLAELTAQDTAKRIRAARYENFLHAAASATERIEYLEKQNQATEKSRQALEEIGKLSNDVSNDLHARSGFAFSGGGLIKDLLVNLVAAGLDDITVRCEMRTNEIKRLQKEVEEARAAMAEVEAEDTAASK